MVSAGGTYFDVEGEDGGDLITINGELSTSDGVSNDAANPPIVTSIEEEVTCQAISDAFKSCLYKFACQCCNSIGVVYS